MKLENLLNEIQTFSDLEKVLENTKPHLSFWGHKYYTISECEEEIHLNCLFTKMLEVRKSNVDFDEQERAIGKRVYKKIEQLHGEGCALVRTASFITRLILSLRWFLHMANYAFQCRIMGYDRLFESYTDNQFIEKFGISPKVAIKNSPPGTIEKYNYGKVNLWDVSKNYQPPLIWFCG